MAEWMAEEKDALLTVLGEVRDALTRQAVVMERDVEAEQLPKTIEDALDKQNLELTDIFVKHVQALGNELDNIITATYLSDMHRAKAIRNFQKKLVKFEGIE